MAALYIVIQKSENFLNEKNVKITKRENAFKDFSSIYNVKILISFNPEVQLKDNESVKSQVIELLTQFKGIKFATT